MTHFLPFDAPRLERARHKDCGGALLWIERSWKFEHILVGPLVSKMALCCDRCAAVDVPTEQREPEGAVCWVEEDA